MITFGPIEAWAFKRLLTGHHLNGDLAAVCNPWNPLASLMETMADVERLPAWQGAIVRDPDRDAIRQAVVSVDPNAPMPAAPTARQFATLADVRRQMAQVRWVWEGWIPASRVLGVAAFEGVGKTRFFLDLARRIWHRLEWPDGQSQTFPAGTRTLWVCADGHQEEIADAAREFGLPDEAIVFPAPQDDPCANVSLDDPDTFTWIDQAMADVRPGLSFIDTLTYATTRDLCEQRSVAFLKTPLIDLVQKHQTNIVLSLHVSREGQALGRRIKGITRTLIHLECPDPEKSERLRLWVEKTYGKKPPALGVTMGTNGNVYDSNPPARPDPNKGGRPARGRTDAVQFIRDELAKQNDQIGNDMQVRWQGGSKDTFWRAVEDMVASGDLAVTGGKGTRQQTILHLVSTP